MTDETNVDPDPIPEAPDPIPEGEDEGSAPVPADTEDDGSTQPQGDPA